MQRQFDPAEAALRRALEIDPDYTIARQNLAGLPAIRATGKLPAMRMNKAFVDKPGKVSLAMGRMRSMLNRLPVRRSSVRQ